LLIAGLPIDDPSGYADLVCSLMDWLIAPHFVGLFL
jgi:hypothetical protein